MNLPESSKLSGRRVETTMDTRSILTFIEDERRWFYFLFATQDQKEGMKAFVERRPPE